MQEQWTHGKRYYKEQYPRKVIAIQTLTTMLEIQDNFDDNLRHVMLYTW